MQATALRRVDVGLVGHVDFAKEKWRRVYEGLIGTWKGEGEEWWEW